MSSGPEGTVFGSLLIMKVFSDIPSATQRITITSYAHDTKVSQVIQNSGDVMHRQYDLDEIYKRVGKNGMQTNAEKFQTFCYLFA